MVPKKVAMHSPGNPGKRRYRVDMLVDTWNGSPRHVCSRECIINGNHIIPPYNELYSPQCAQCAVISWFGFAAPNKAAGVKCLLGVSRCVLIPLHQGQEIAVVWKATSLGRTGKGSSQWDLLGSHWWCQLWISWCYHWIGRKAQWFSWGKPWFPAKIFASTKSL